MSQVLDFPNDKNANGEIERSIPSPHVNGKVRKRRNLTITQSFDLNEAKINIDTVNKLSHFGGSR